MAEKTTIGADVPVPLRDLLFKVAERRETTVSKLLYGAAAEIVSEEFELTSGDGLAEAQEIAEAQK